jgi:hypothetical protein
VFSTIFVHTSNAERLTLQCARCASKEDVCKESKNPRTKESSCIQCQYARAGFCKPIPQTNAKEFEELRALITNEGSATRRIIYQTAFGLLGGLVMATASDFASREMTAAVADQEFLRGIIRGDAFYNMTPYDALRVQVKNVKALRKLEEAVDDEAEDDEGSGSGETGSDAQMDEDDEEGTSTKKSVKAAAQESASDEKSESEGEKSESEGEESESEGEESSDRDSKRARVEDPSS